MMDALAEDPENDLASAGAVAAKARREPTVRFTSLLITQRPK